MLVPLQTPKIRIIGIMRELALKLLDITLLWGK